MTTVIWGFEGKSPFAYTDPNGITSVGVGFNMEQPDARKIFQKALPGVSFDKVYGKERGLTNQEISKLFQVTLNEKIEVTKHLFTNYETYPDDVKIALVNGVFRGEFKRNHRVVKLINNGEWDKVAEEYLNRRDYRESKPGVNGGIKTRMDYNAEIYRRYAKQLKG